MAKAYGQFCALARALDVVGERWTLLIARELLIQPRRYVDIRRALPGIASNLLAQRLRDLEAAGLVARMDDARYELTPSGRDLEPVVHALVRWGKRRMTDRGDDLFLPQWLVVAMGALVKRPKKGSIEFQLGHGSISLDARSITVGRSDSPDAVVQTDPETLLAVAGGHLGVDVLDITGDRALVSSVFAA